jgi:hypothetical protein
MRDDSNADFQVAVDHMLGEKNAEEDRWYVVIDGSDEALPSIEDDDGKVPNEDGADAGAGREDSETLGGEKGDQEASKQRRQQPQKPKSSKNSARDDFENFWAGRNPDTSQNLERPKTADTLRRMALGGLANGTANMEQQTPVSVRILPPSAKGTPASEISLYDENGFFKDH